MPSNLFKTLVESLLLMVFTSLFTAPSTQLMTIQHFKKRDKTSFICLSHYLPYPLSALYITHCLTQNAS